jgi:hypothetical protein
MVALMLVISGMFLLVMFWYIVGFEVAENLPTATDLKAHSDARAIGRTLDEWWAKLNLASKAAALPYYVIERTACHASVRAMLRAGRGGPHRTLPPQRGLQR